MKETGIVTVSIACCPDAEAQALARALFRVDGTDAQILTKSELLQLLAAFDIDAQRKLTTIRLGDNGKTDRAAALDLGLAQYQIVKQYEAGQ
ncbi:hypothetical protein [Asticcacaulis sp. EMRT-3]|uniref:hypothetical protein n=1 Tax=Asticcacaulis sp. EMRT-3 TaxID=3040349 RepID=UPI0024AEB343|nr:hypothetical protein [Asticcacaulis sp. EMRT-3]MDI7776036.1 hypothetical protein [Asticcacaulis sp. EMRT-3]